MQTKTDVHPAIVSETPTWSFRWKHVAMMATVGTWLTLLVNGVQIWWARQATEDAAYDHMLDVAGQVERAVKGFYAQNRTLSQAVLNEMELPRAFDRPCRLICSEALRMVQRRYLELFPGLELLVLDEHGEVVAETEPDMHDRVKGLHELAAQFRSQRDAMATVTYTNNSRNEPALRCARTHRTPGGELKAVIVIMQPVRLLNEILDVPELGRNRAVTLVDSTGVLLARDPAPKLIHVGKKMESFLEESRPGRGAGSFFATSKIDRVDRLWITREIPYTWSPGGLTVYIGTSLDDYLASWYRLTLFSAFTCFMLLTGWIWGLSVFRNAARFKARLMGTMNVMHQVMESTPVPVVVVSQAEGRVVMSNGAMLNLFGALATVGQPLRQLFTDDKPLGRLRESQITPGVVQLLSRKGLIHAELHRTDLGNMGAPFGPCWLMVLVDVSERHQREQHLQREAITDGLTGLVNRRHFLFIAAQKIAAAREHDSPLSILALDLDHFKRVNDEHGHDIGDLVLTTLAGVLKGGLRDSDEAARVGGEEFAALLPRADRQQAVVVAERIRRAIASTPILLPDNQVLTMTVSIGVSVWKSDDVDIQATLKRADQALYVAKNKGRNRVESGEEIESESA